MKFGKHQVDPSEVIPAWSRQTVTLEESVRLSPPTEDSHNADFNYSGWTAYFMYLKTPIAVQGKLEGNVSYNGAVLYPPFALNDAESDVISFRGIRLPDTSEEGVEMPSLLVKRPTIGFSKETVLCNGLRVDVAPGRSARPQIDYMLSLIRERTHQWWLTTDRNPFDLGTRFYVRLGLNHEVLSCEADPKRENQVPWGFAADFQMKLSIERPLDQKEWDQCIAASQIQRRPETATSFFHDMLGSYYAKRNETCIYQACVTLEIMESKLRTLAGKPTNNFALKLLRNSALWLENDKAILKKMFTDRGHIAHGRAPIYVTKDETLIKDYVSLVESYYRRFLTQIQNYDWSEVSKL